jgi:hypothetical protein
MFLPLSLFLSIFVSYPKKKKNERKCFFFFFFLNFWVRLAYAGNSTPRYEYPKSIWYEYGFIFGVSVFHRLNLLFYDFENLRFLVPALSVTLWSAAKQSDPKISNPSP